MVSELKEKLLYLESELKKRENKSYIFFKDLHFKISHGLIDEAVDSILKSYSIIQYANFYYKEEIIFEEIWQIAENIKKRGTNL